MKIKLPRYLSRMLIGFLLLAPAQFANAQSARPPEREMLLNGLAVLFWPQPGDANVFLKLRIHSGAAFDLANKAGEMSLLADVLFPDPSAREYVSEQLGGKLDISTSYDAIDITLSGKANELERMIELLRNALVTTNLSADTVAKVRDARIKELTDHPASPAQLADRAIAKRLFGSFPYGNPPGGTPETLSKVDRADLMLARDRFLHPDNASLVIIGGVDKPRLMRALRQLLGPWQKGEVAIPATFRQPNPPPVPVLLLNEPSAKTAEIRLAVRGVARADRDFAAASLLAQIAQERWQAAVPGMSSSFVRNEAHVLPGMFVFGATASVSSASRAVSAAQEVIRALVETGPTGAELDRARATRIAEMNKAASRPESIADAWLDVGTHKLPAGSAMGEQFANISTADVQRVAERLFKNIPRAIVVVGDAAQLKSAFGASLEPRAPSQPDVGAPPPAPTPLKP